MFLAKGGFFREAEAIALYHKKTCMTVENGTYMFSRTQVYEKEGIQI